jgi:iron complex outermembrane receptor protein
MKKSNIIQLLMAGTALCAAQTAVAQDNSPNDESAEEVNGDILVVGQPYRGDFNDLETPQSNQVLDTELLRNANALDLNAALDLSASVARQNNFGGLWNAFSVRGLSGDINLPSGFLVNGFNAGRGFGGPRDISGVEAVEVLKGPRSALYGRGEPGGTVNLVTKRPEFETGGYAQFQGGSFDFYRGEVDVQTTLGDNVGVRVAAFYEDAGSFRGPIESERFGITVQLSDSTSATYELEYSEQDIPFDRGVVFAEPFGFSPIRTFTGEPQDGPIETDVLGHQFQVQHEFSDDWSILAGVGFRDTTLVGNATEPNFVGRQTFNLDGQTISRFFRSRDFDSEYFVARAEISGTFETGALTHNVIFGADYDSFQSDLFILRFRGPFIPAGTDINTLDPQALLFLDAFNPVFGQFPIPDAGPNTNRSENLDGFGIYVQDQIEITDKLQVRLGGRFDSFDQDLTNLQASPATTLSSSSSRFSPQFGVVYEADKGVSLYASYGEGFRQQTGSDFEGNQFAPTTTESFEIGIKAEIGEYFDGVQGLVQLTAFHIDQDNFLVNDTRPEATATGFFSFPAGEARSQGIEFDLNLAFDSGFNFFLSYAHVDAEFTNTNPDENFGALIEEGDPLINSPGHQLAIQLSQDFDIGDRDASIGGGLLHVGSRNGFTGFDFELPSYTTVRAFAQVEIVEGLVLRADIDNIFDTVFFTNSFADVWIQPGAPRTFRGSLRFSF